jgi:hypothetical protein
VKMSLKKNELFFNHYFYLSSLIAFWYYNWLLNLLFHAVSRGEMGERVGRCSAL